MSIDLFVHGQSVPEESMAILEVAACYLVFVEEDEEVVVAVGAGVSAGAGAVEPQGCPLGQDLLSEGFDAVYDLRLVHGGYVNGSFFFER